MNQDLDIQCIMMSNVLFVLLVENTWFSVPSSEWHEAWRVPLPWCLEWSRHGHVLFGDVWKLCPALTTTGHWSSADPEMLSQIYQLPHTSIEHQLKLSTKSRVIHDLSSGFFNLFFLIETWAQLALMGGKWWESVMGSSTPWSTMSEEPLRITSQMTR